MFFAGKLCTGPNTSHCSGIALFCLLEPYADLVGAYMAGAWLDDANLLQYVEIDGTPYYYGNTTLRSAQFVSAMAVNDSYGRSIPSSALLRESAIPRGCEP